MRKLRIVFMGTPNFAVATLAALVDNGYEVVGVVTAPDRPAGRGRKIQSSAVKQFAEQKRLLVLQPTNLKDPDFLATLRDLDANLQVVVAFRMLPRAVWEMPEYGTFNLHASLLPDYRGAAPINWAIINGESQTGVTTFFIDDKIDTGEIILQEALPIDEDETAGILHDKLMHLGAKLVVKTVAMIAKNEVVTQKQPVQKQQKTAPKLYKETCKIDWGKSIHAIHNHIRGLSPYPAAWAHLINGDKKLSLKIYRTDKELVSHQHPNGSLFVTKNEMKVAVEGGYLKLLEVQLQGAKKMNIRDLLNGLKLEETAYMA
ncbi:methionyl-tRNA formyltransferase [Flavobacteriaceae bacterium TP-CH-4]|uniref:Methionyl-tRNA formyltransferase n=1 Tax=Pelagihabitans pacificus TaxID=2696054 RepID=A0A967AUP1_9FLAO|nr:methionyl-tRNA formyltransferase [Pelagihabitans pacificus]NHF60277.1 methionyl-tRNA formyltransferase [Pelagihabitans pacificus]